MTRWQVFRELLSATRDPARLGDVAVLKSELGGQKAAPHIEALLDPVRGFHPRVDVEHLRSLPEGTFGRAYARFLDDNHLSPFQPSHTLPADMVARNAFVARYGAIHDMVHVLLGFDATWAGEAGVWAFVGQQGYSAMFRVASVASLLVAPLRSPLRLPAVWQAWNRGRALARGAELLVTQRLEDHLERPLHDVRQDLGLAVA
jgi:ubiquinone biosynthesis protein COQ4